MLLTAALALAQSDPELAFTRSITAARVGRGALTAGAVAEVGGYLIGSPPLVVGGAVTAGLGVPTMAVSSLTARRALARLGDAPTAAPGIVAVAAWGGGVALGAARLGGVAPDTLGVELTDLGLTLGALVAASVQLQLDEQAWMEVPAVEEARRPTPSFAVSPTLGRDRAGLAATLTW